MRIKLLASIGLGLSLLGFSSHLWGGSFLEMPETLQVPELERESMLMDMDVPAVRDRNPDPRAGPRLNVKEFRVQGLVEYPELGIHRSEIMKKVEQLRFDYMNEEKLLDSGYTLDELASLSDLIAEIEEETDDRHVGPLEVQRIVFHVREQRRRRGMTLGMIETVADTITDYYRERGFILAKAYIPKQKVRNGIVNLTVLLGTLGEVRINNNHRYSDDMVARRFEAILDKPVTSAAIEEHLFLVNDLPGLSAQGYFEPGVQVGDAAMNINVTSEKWYDANIRLDNHGSESSGEYRLYADVFLHNPLGIGDQLQVGVLNSFNPDNSLYGTIRYSLPLFHPRVGLSIGASQNDFELSENQSEAIRDLEVTGGSHVKDISLDYVFTRRRIKNTSLSLRYSEVESELSFGGSGSNEFDNIVRNLDLTYRFDFLNERSRTLHQGGIGVIGSQFVEGAQGDQEEYPWILPMDYTLMTFATLPIIDLETRLVIRSAAQYSGTSLSSVNQFSLAGPNRARAYALNAFYADDGAHLGVDWIFQGPGFFGDYIQPMVFADYSYGVAHPVVEGSEETESTLSDAGLGLRFGDQSKVRGSLTVAAPLQSENTALEEGETVDEGVRVYMDIQYSF